MDNDAQIIFLNRKANINAKQARQTVQDLVRSARVSQHGFLIYLFGLVLEELANIENGRETDF